MPEEKINIYHDKEICFRDSEKEEEPKINQDSESEYNQMVGLWELNEKKDFWRNHEIKGVMNSIISSNRLLPDHLQIRYRFCKLLQDSTIQFLSLPSKVKKLKKI